MSKETNKKYFNAEDIQHFREYILAADKWEKDKIYNQHLYKFIDKHIDAVIKQMNIGGSKHIMDNYEDMKQDLHIHILTYTLAKVDITRVQAIQNLIYISIKNKLINMLKSLDSRTKIKFDNNDYNIDEAMLVDDYELSIEDIIKIIDNRIEELKQEQVAVNSVNYTYLELLHRFVLDNDYDASGFKEYCMKEMNIGNSRFMNLSHSFGFRTPAFKRNKNVDIYNY